MVTVGDGLVILWAVATGIVLFVGLARALDAPPARPRRSRSTARRVAERVRAAVTEDDAAPSTVAPSGTAAAEPEPPPLPGVWRSRGVDARALAGARVPATEEGPSGGPDRASLIPPLLPPPAEAPPPEAEPPSAEPREERRAAPPWRGALPAPATMLPRTLVAESAPAPHLAVAREATVEGSKASTAWIDASPRAPAQPSSPAGEAASAPAATPAAAVPPADAGVDASGTTESPRGAVEDAVLRCLELEESELHAELVGLASRSVLEAPLPAEGVTEAGEMPPIDRAALLALLARGRAALGDASGAATALEACEAVGVDAGEPTTARRLRHIGGRVGRRLLLWAESTAEDSDERLRALEVALTWLDRAQRAEPGDGDATTLAAHTGDTLTTARDQRIAALVGRREFAEALKQLGPALTGSGLADARRRGLGELLWTSVAGEVGRLTEQAPHGPGGRRALGTMREAERLARSPVTRKLPRERRQDIDRRIRSGYLAVGAARVEAGDLTGSLDPLARAMGVVSPKPATLRAGPSALAPLIETLVARWGDRILGLARDGDQDTAMTEARGLSRLIDAAFAHGLTAEDLKTATERRQALMLEIAAEPAP